MDVRSLSSSSDWPCFLLRFESGCSIVLDCPLDLVATFADAPVTSLQRAASAAAWSSAPAANVKRVRVAAGLEIANVDVMHEHAFPTSTVRVPDLAARASAAPQTTLESKLPPLPASSLSRLAAFDVDSVDWHSVDAVLISNPMHGLALPCIMRSGAFEGQVFATEPTAQLLRQMLLDLAVWMRTVGDAPSARPELAPFTVDEVELAMSRVQPMSFDQRVELGEALSARPVSSGFCLGGSNWVLQYRSRKIVYLSASSRDAEYHPQELDVEALRGADVLIAAAVCGGAEPPSLDAVLEQSVRALKHRGNVLLPVFAQLHALQLLEALGEVLVATKWGERVPVFVVSPSAQQCLSYANVAGEWMNEARRKRIYVPTDPFKFSAIKELYTFADVAELQSSGKYREPCIVLCGHPSLRCGDAMHFLRTWRGSSQHLLALTEPFMDHLDAMRPIRRSLRMEVVSSPQERRLQLGQLQDLLTQIAPVATLLPRDLLGDVTLTKPEGAASLPPPVLYERHSHHRFDLPGQFDEARVDGRLAARIEVHPLSNNSLHLGGWVHGTMDLHDRSFVVSAADDGEAVARAASAVPRFFGVLAPERVLHALHRDGLRDAYFESHELVSSARSDLDRLIRIPSLDVTIVSRPHETKIVGSCRADQLRVTDVVAQLLRQFGRIAR